MTISAEIVVNNRLNHEISVTRYLVGDGTEPDIDLTKTLLAGEGDKIPLPGPETYLSIMPPIGVDMGECWLKVKSDADLEVSHSRSGSNWMIKLIPPPSDLSQALGELPTSATVDVGENPPEPGE